MAISKKCKTNGQTILTACKEKWRRISNKSIPLKPVMRRRKESRNKDSRKLKQKSKILNNYYKMRKTKIATKTVIWQVKMIIYLKRTKHCKKKFKLLKIRFLPFRPTDKP